MIKGKVRDGDEKRIYRGLSAALASICIVGMLTACQEVTDRSKEAAEKAVQALASAVKKDGAEGAGSDGRAEKTEEDKAGAEQSRDMEEEKAGTEDAGEDPKRDGMGAEEAGIEEGAEEAGTGEGAEEAGTGKDTEQGTDGEGRVDQDPSAWLEMGIYIEERSGGYQEGQVVLTDESYEIIQVDEENYPELARALRTYEEECAADVVRWRNGVLEAARAGHEGEGEGEGEYYTPLRYDRKLSVKRADAQVFSICVQDVWNPNVAGVELISCGKDLDSQTGKELVLEDVVVVDERFIDTLITEFYEQRPAEIPSISYVDAPEALIAGQFRPGQPAEDRPRWTLGNNGITFYYDSRMILEGTLTIEVILPFDRYPELFRPAYRKGPEAFAQRFEEGDVLYFDIDHDGQLEAIRMNGWGKSGFDQHLIRIYVDDEARYSQDFTYISLGEIYLLKDRDGDYYLYLETIEVDEMSRILVFDLNEGAPVYKGECFGWFCGGQMTSPDHFELGERINVLGGHYAARPFHMGKDGLPEADSEIYQIEQEVYDAGDGTITKCWIRTKAPVPAQQILEDGTRKEAQVPAGVRCYPYRSDRETFVEIELEDGRRYRLDYGGKDWPHTIRGVDESEYFDDLVYAG